MSDILLDTQATPTTPAAGKAILYADSGTKRGVNIEDSGTVRGILSRSVSNASQGAGFAVDTYITSSNLLIPTCGIQVGQTYRWRVALSKTAAGVAAPIIIIRLGAAGAIGDAAIVTLTGQAATAAISGGFLDVQASIRSVGAAGVMAASFGFATGILGFGGGIDGVSAGFDTTGRSGQFMGVSYNGGAAAVITVTNVTAELIA